MKFTLNSFYCRILGMNQKILFFLIPFFILLIISITYFKKQALIQMNQNAYDNIKYTLNKTVTDEKDKSFSLAIALSKNTILREALIEDDEVLGFTALSEAVEYLKKYIKKTDIYSQILTKDLVVFTRSWDETFSGIPLESFRKDLKEVQLSKKPKVEIEIGRMISIKASVPILHENDIVGTLEIITLLDVLVDKLREYKLELFPLMNIDYMENAYLMNDNPMVLEEYILANKNYNKLLLSVIKKLSWDEFEKLLKIGYINKDEYYFFVYDMTNNKGDSLGKFLLVSSSKNIENFYGNDYTILQSIFNLNSTNEDVYNFLKYEESINNNKVKSKKNISDDLLYSLNKEELIELIKSSKQKKEIRGIIK